MHVQFSFQGTDYTCDTRQALDISLPLRSGSGNPNCYYADPVVFETIRAGSFVGEVAEGGPCNHKKITLSPHGNGTHTECYGHISADADARIYHCLRQFHFFAQLISVSPRQTAAGDQIITRADLEARTPDSRPEALIIRTMPNEESKRQRQYSGTNPPYLEPEAGAYLAGLGVKHLIVDIPSVDREVDGGLLQTHRAFWNYPQQTRRDCTITELAYISDEIRDGLYLLNLQVISLDLDVSPSKPVLYRLEPVNA
jgi:arylformamidase